LLAIAYKKVDIVRYFLHDMHIALRHAGKQPGVEGGLSADEMAAQQVYSVIIAIANRDLKMLEELWKNNYTAWDETHL
jgi:hypothetical protein